MPKRFHVYILATRPQGPLFIGVTSDLVSRVYQHKTNAVQGFTKKYTVHQLVYFEEHPDAQTAIA